MPEDRPPIPRPLEREVKEEAGFRCAIPTCLSSAALEMAHIEPWAKVRKHEFSNLILLCRNDHYRFDQGEIPRASIRQYKLNLAVVNGRYGTLERRVLQWFADNGPSGTVILPPSSELMVSFLERDGLLEIDPVYVGPGARTMQDGNWVALTAIPSGYRLTAIGHEFLRRWLGAVPVE